MPNRRHSSRRFTPSCSNSITNSCRCDMIDFSDHGTPAPPQQAKDADRMRQPCLRTPVHYLSGPYTLRERGTKRASAWWVRVSARLKIFIARAPSVHSDVVVGGAEIVDAAIGRRDPAGEFAGF